MNPLEYIATVLIGVNVALAARQSVWCFPVGIVGVALFAVVCFQANLYASFGLQFVFLALNVYGWYEWIHGGDQKEPLRVRRTRPAMLLLLMSGGVLMTFAIGFITTKYEAALAYWDAAIAGFSIVAQFMMARKMIEHWYLWLAVDVIAVGTYWTRGLRAFAVLYAVLFCLCCWGVIEWRRSLAASA